MSLLQRFPLIWRDADQSGQICEPPSTSTCVFCNVTIGNALVSPFNGSVLSKAFSLCRALP